MTIALGTVKPRVKRTLRVWWLLALWTLAFVGFAQQSFWAKLLAPLGGALYERNTLLELTGQHLQLSLGAMLGVLVIGLPLVVYHSKKKTKIIGAV